MNISRYYKAIESRAYKYVYERKGFKTNRKIIVIESEDWGSIRMPSLNALNKLLSKDTKFDLSLGYDKYDTLASNDDLEKLMEVLSSVKDINSNAAKITLNCVLANPDFKKIKDSNFTEYHYELFTQTLNTYSNHSKSFDLWKEGINGNILKPQYHGREHLNVLMWLNSLQADYKGVRNAFNEHVFSMLLDKHEDERLHHLAAYNFKFPNEVKFIHQSFEDGLRIFESIFGYKSKSMIAPCYIWDNNIEDLASKLGVKYIQGASIQKFPIYTRTLTGKEYKFHYMGELNNNDQIYMVRNCLFEPSQNYKLDFNHCLKEIETAFRWNKPAIISSHRLNFIGELENENRKNTLKQFQQLLKIILKKWPNVEFMSSDELGDLIAKNG